MTFRKINRAIHRDLGYLFAGMTIIYAISGIALNHVKDFNPNYSISRITDTIAVPADIKENSKKGAIEILKLFGEEAHYRKHYFPNAGELKIFLSEGGSILVNIETGHLLFEQLEKRPILHQMNFLHYNPGFIWKWFSDFFALVLIILALSGLFILKGKNGITKRGAWLTITGIIIPLLFLLMYY